MYPHTFAFAEAIDSGSYRIATDVQIWSGVNGDSVVAESGSFTVSRAAAQRRTCSLTIRPDPGLIPMSSTALLTPFGNQMRPFFGIKYPNGSSELVPMGVYILTDVDAMTTSADVTITVTGSDLSWGVSQRKFRNAFDCPSATPEVSIQAILNTVFPGLSPLNMPPTGVLLPSPLPAFKEGDDPWAACLTLADAAGCELFFDLLGIPTGRPIPAAATTAPSWFFADGPKGVTSAKRTWTRSGVSNDFIVSGSGTKIQPPVRGEASDQNPGSRTYVNGTYGDIPTFDSSSLVTSSGTAQNAAQNALTAAQGSTEQIVVTCSPNPCWDIDDVMSLQVARLGIDGNYVIDTIRHAFGVASDTGLDGRAVL